MAISMVKIRARITVGSLVVETPYILSFNVNQVRGQISTFDASIKVSHSDISSSTISGDYIQIEAGEGSPSNTIFSGIVRKATISPVFDDPSYVLVNLSGADVLSILEGKKFTRRCRATRSTWVSINNVVRQGLRSSKFKAKKKDIINLVNTQLKTEDENVDYTTVMDKIKEAPKGSNKPNLPQLINSTAVKKEGS